MTNRKLKGMALGLTLVLSLGNAGWLRRREKSRAEKDG